MSVKNRYKNLKELEKLEGLFLVKYINWLKESHSIKIENSCHNEKQSLTELRVVSEFPGKCGDWL